MNTQEQAYHNHLLNLNDSMAVALSYRSIRDHRTDEHTAEDAAYFLYWMGLTTEQFEEADYRIFSGLYDLIPAALHPAYEAAFSLVGYSLAEKCRRKSAPPH